MKPGDIVRRKEYGWLAIVLNTFYKLGLGGYQAPYVIIMWDNGMLDTCGERHLEVVIEQ
jgi:hypothetical protein